MENTSMYFRILDQTVSVELEPLAERIRMDEALPFLRALDDQAIGIVTKKHGQPVTCAKGCSACCRVQLVPVTPAEAYALLRWVEEMPEPRRTEVLARFSDRIARLEAAGLIADCLADCESRPVVTQYVELGLVCPFLADEACSIYEQRPFACRQYLVTTAKELCATPVSSPVKTVPMIFAPAAALLEAAAELNGETAHTIPLTVALIYAQLHRAELERTYLSREVLSRSLRSLFVAAIEKGSLLPETPQSPERVPGTFAC